MSDFNPVYFRCPHCLYDPDAMIRDVMGLSDFGVTLTCPSQDKLATCFRCKKHYSIHVELTVERRRLEEVVDE